MSKIDKTVFAFVVLLVAAQVLGEDPPPRPACFYGTVTAAGNPVPAGTVASASIDGVPFAETETFVSEGLSVFRLDVPADFPDTGPIEGGVDGQTVVFKVQGTTVPQTALWQDGVYERVDLTAPVGSDLAIEIDDGVDVVLPGETVTYSLSAINGGSEEATGVAVTGTLPDFTTFVSASDGGTEAGGTVTWPVFELAAGASAVRTVTVAVDPTVGAGVEQLTSTATVTDDGTHGFDPDSGNNTATDTDVVDAGPDLVVAKTDGRDEIAPGETLSYSLTITNAGTQDAIGVQLTDHLPPYVTFFTATGDGGETRPGIVTWPPFALAAGETVTRTIKLRFDGAVGQSSITNEATATAANGPDLNPADNTGTDVTLVRQEIDLTVVGVDPSPAVTDPQSLALSGEVAVTIGNVGNSDAGSFAVAVFEDLDGDGALTAADNLLGETAADGTLAGGTVSVAVPVSGTVRFRDNWLYAFADHAGEIAERDETNNVGHSRRSCLAAPTPEDFQPVVETSWPEDDDQLTEPLSRESTSTPIVVQLTDDDGDGRIDAGDVPDIVLVTANLVNPLEPKLKMRAIRGDSGGTIWAVDPPVSQFLVFSLSGLAAGDIDGDGIAEIIVATPSPPVPPLEGFSNHLAAYEHTGTLKWTSSAYVTHPTGETFTNRDNPTLADLDRDGVPEIIVGANVFNHDGTLRWTGSGGHAYQSASNRDEVDSGAISIVADLDLAGDPEVVTGNTAYRSDGTVYWQIAAADGYPAVGNFDSDDHPEIVVVARGRVRLHEHDGTLIWGPVELPGTGDEAGGAPTVADFDADGEPEIGVAGSTFYAVFETDGSVKWQRVIQDGSSNMTGSTVFDLDADGRYEVIYRDETHLRIYRGEDGVVLFEDPVSSFTANEEVVVADVDADGRAEILVTSDLATAISAPERTFGLRVYGDANDNWVATRRIWNQHAYHCDNVGDDGTVPAHPEPSWLGHNSFRANCTAADEAHAAPDLSASHLTVDLGAYPVLTFTARIGNAGEVPALAGTPIAFYDGDPAAGGQPMAVAILAQNLWPGTSTEVRVTAPASGFGPAAVYVVANDDGDGNRRRECHLANNQHHLLYTTEDVGLALTMADGLTAVRPGDAVTYVLTAANASAATRTGVLVTDTLPPHTTLVSASDGGTEAAGEVRWPLFELAPGATAVRTLTLRVDAALPLAVTALTNTATVVDDGTHGPDPTPENNTASDVNAVPVVFADPGGPYGAAEGSAVAFDASASSTRDGTLVLYEWDLDADGWFDDASGPTAVHAFADDGLFNVALRVTNDGGESGQATVEVVIENVAPTVDAGGDRTQVGPTLNLFAEFTDPGTADTHAATIDWGDGTVENVAAGDGQVSAAHAYDTSAVVMVEVCVEDDDGGRGCDAAEVTVVIEPDLTVPLVDATQVTTDRQTLEAAGTVRATVHNAGHRGTESGFRVLFFEDRNASGAFEPGADLVVGEVEVDALAPGERVDVSARVDYTIAFAGNPIHAFADGRRAIDESNETNNLDHSGRACGLWLLAGKSDPFEAVVEWSWTESPVEPTFKQVIMAPVVADLTGEGIADIVFNTRASTGAGAQPGLLRAIRGDGGGTIFDLPAPDRRTWSPSTPAVGDVDGDGWPEIIAVLYAGGIVALEHTGEEKWVNTEIAPPSSAGPAIANVDGEGLPEIVVGAAVVNPDGTVRWNQGEGRGLGLASVADLDLDGKLEIIAGSNAWTHDGTAWYGVALGDGYTAVANFDSDPHPEIVLVSGSKIYLQEHTGEVRWSLIHPGSRGGPPVVADVDGDGEVEIGVAGRSEYVVVDTDGSILWSHPIVDSSGKTSSSAFDFDGDGAAELLHNDHYYLRIYRGRDGAVLYETPNPTGTGHEHPVIADLDGDGSAEIVAARNQVYHLGNEVGIYDQGVVVYGHPTGAWPATRRVWNQHSYHGTNIGDDLAVPTREPVSWLLPGGNVYRSQRGPVTSRADLIPSFLRLDASRCPVELTLTARIGNGGDLPAPAAPTAFYRGNPGAGGTLLGTIAGADLDPGERQDLTLLSSALIGPGTICIAADDDGSGFGSVEECNETDFHCVDYLGLCDSSDLEVTLSDGRTVAAAGTVLTYTLTVTNHGPAPVTGVTVSDALPATLLDATWTCAAGQGADCTPGPVAGNVDDSVSLATGAAVTYTIRATVAPEAAGTVVNTATVSSPHVDPHPGNETAHDETEVDLVADLEILTTDDRTVAVPGAATTYTITVLNHGPSDVSGATVIDRFPAELLSVGWTCVAAAGATCTPGPVRGDLYDTVDLVAGAEVVYTATATIDPEATAAVTNRALVTAARHDPDLGNNVAVDATGLLAGEPDLVVAGVDASAVVADGQSLAAAGTVAATIGNAGNQRAEGFAVVFFADRNRSGAFEGTADLELSEAPVAAGLGIGESVTVAAAVSYDVLFAGEPIHAFADAWHEVSEADETNNVAGSGTECEVPVTLDFAAQVEWSWTDSPVEPEFNQVIATPIVADLNADGIPDVVFNTRGTSDAGGQPGLLRAIRGDGGGSLFDLADPELRTYSSSHVAVGDVDGDGRPEIIAALWDRGVVALEHTGEVKWVNSDLDLDKHSGAVLANVDGEGLPEIVFGGAVLNPDGTLRWRASFGAERRGEGLATVADLDLDGTLEITVGATAWNHDGSVFYTSSVGDGFTAVGNFDTDLFPEIVVVGGGRISLLEHTGQLRWSLLHPGRGGGPPAVADLDGDGEAEVAVGGQSQFVVVDTDGSVLWSHPIWDKSARTCASVFDFQNDGSLEVLYNDHFYLRVFRGRDGALLSEIGNPSGTGSENPVVADVDADGRAEIVVGRNKVYNNGQGMGIDDQGIFVFGDPSDGWVGTRGLWNQHGYHITNVGDDLTVPQVEAENWLLPGLNNFRAQAQPEGNPFAAPDLTVSRLELDQAACPGEVVVRARIGNGGAELAPAAQVAFYRGDRELGGALLGVVSTTGALPPGEFESVGLRVEGPPQGAVRICVAVDDEGAGAGPVNECREDNNVQCLETTGLCDQPEPPTVSIADATVIEGTGATVNAVFPLQLSRPSGREIRISYATADGTARAVEDYQATSGVAVIPAGETMGAVTVVVAGDALDEDDETFAVLLSSPVNVTLARGEAVGVIVDDDEPPAVGIADVTVGEGDGGTVNAVLTVALTALSSREIRVAYATADGSAMAGEDYTPSSGTLILPPGTSSGTVTVQVLGDVGDEPDETFTVTLSNPENVTLDDPLAVATILDDDEPPQLQVSTVTVTEGVDTEATFTVTLSAESGFDVDVDFATADGTAEVVLDYQSASGSLSFPPGTVSRTVAVTIVDDALDEETENFLLSLSNAAHAVLPVAPGVGTIVDNDPPPSVSVSDVSVTEGDSGTVEALFLLTLSGASGREIRVGYQTVDGNAAAGDDYLATSGTAVLPPGTETREVTVAVRGDLLDEPDETFRLLLSSPVNVTIADGEGLGTILDDDEPPTVDVNDVSVAEGDRGWTDAIFTLSLSARSGFDVTVGYATSDGSAQAGTDYLTRTDTATVPAGDRTAQITVEVIGDLVDELDETFRVELTNPQHVVIGDGLGEATIVDDDEALISIDDVELGEGDVGTQDAVFTVELATESDREVRVDYVTAPETATADEDYLTVSGTLVFPAFTTVRTVAVPVVGDVVLERDETFRVELANPVNTTIADSVGVGTILDDEICAGPNLLVNPGAEARPVAGELPGWIEVAGSDWQRRFADPDPAEGGAYFFAGTAEYAELVQDVDLSAYVPRIAAGEQIFEFIGAVRTADEVPPDVARIVVEYRDLNNALVLEAFDSGEIASPYEWHPVSDVRAAPVGTGWIRVRLISNRFTEGTNDGYFDALSLRSLRAPTVVGKDAASKLALQLVATKLNLVRGSDPWIVPVVEAADAFLDLYPPGSDPRGEARQQANAIKDDLDDYNNSCDDDD